MKRQIRSVLQECGHAISRRSFLSQTLAVTAAVSTATKVFGQGLSGPKPSAMVTIENFSPAGKSEGRVQVARVAKSDADWRKELPRDSYQVTRHADTEVPFSGKNWNNHQSGLYRCICCDTAVFDSQTKFESGTGWPSFWQPISRINIVESPDNSLGMRRTAVSCSRCDAHLGHVFDDGPKPTGLRYCMNSVAMRFVPRA
jgi:peptide-methionine (R)-S-oxide reductase